jgi:hypothetical protein
LSQTVGTEASLFKSHEYNYVDDNSSVAMHCAMLTVYIFVEDSAKF